MESNYLRDVANSFGLTPPPEWWLREMRLFDDRLVLFPSQKRKVWVLARRGYLTREPLHMLIGVPQHPDAVVMNSRNLLRVTEIDPRITWDMQIFRKLAAHDIQRLGGYKEVNRRLEDMDERKERSIQSAQNDELEARSAAGYKSYKTRIGERLSLVPNPNGRGTLVKRPVSVSIRKPIPAPSAPLVTLTDAPSPA